MGKLLFSIIILIIIIVMLFPSDFCGEKKWQCERYKHTINIIKKISTTIRQFQSDRKFFPKYTDIFPLEKTQIKYPNQIKIDAWGNLFIYVVKEKGEKFLLYSVGKNGIDEFGKGDDILLESEHNKNIYCD
ncbi:hypothetical protein PN36_32030 [Candidatus Thiomargarita nelsonii]|uniref:Type II secretion system protein GspG C-terminal domain-containing protein n=1 Tax=Candidatus Thiomargarita nelsonii TaxID=1003181 RepID=A0A4E0QQH7_9GAMM|nr:hypothetical protein PN36_32030 [Candidatus Thiomargarita nelsonii]